MNAVNAARPEVTAIGPGSLRARLDLLLEHAITLDNFEADVTRVCQAQPEEIWTVLALLDQYHRRGLLPTPLFRTLKASADRRSLGRQGIAPPAPAAAAAAANTPAAPAPAPSSAPAASPAPAASAPAASPAPAAAAPAAATPAAAASAAPAAAPVSAAASTPTQAPLPLPMPVPTHTPVPVAAPAATLPAGTVLRNRYVLEAMLGRGRRSTVYRALDRERSKLPQASQHVALKILHASAIGDASALAALRVEFQCAQSLSHPNIVNVFELEQDGPLTFMTMELLDGDTLGSLLERYQRQPLPRPLALAIIRDVGAALVHAHERGVVHGSLHPRHIMITANGEVRVTNFAAARLGPGDQAPETHAYASCEALQGQVADRRDDLYALACISYELLAGHHPFNRLTAAQARGRALVPRRPLRLGRRPWRSLRAGLAWRRENRTLGIGWWLGRMNLGAAAARLPSLRELMSPPPPARSNLVRPAVLAACLGATIVVAARLDRLPSSEHLSQGWHELRAVAQGNPLRRLGDWMSPSVTTTSTAGRRAPDSTRHAAAGGNQRRGRIVSKDPATPAPVADAPAAGASAVDAQPVDAQPAPGQAAAESTNTPVSSERSSSTTADSPLRLAASKAPPMHLEFSTDNYTVLPGEPAARVEVRRRGNLLGDVSFVWSTEAASAQPERDFVASGPRAEQIPAGTSSVTLLVPIISDAARSESRVFYVTIAEPGGGAELGANTRASVLVAGGN